MFNKQPFARIVHGDFSGMYVYYDGNNGQYFIRPESEYKDSLFSSCFWRGDNYRYQFNDIIGYEELGSATHNASATSVLWGGLLFGAVGAIAASAAGAGTTYDTVIYFKDTKKCVFRFLNSQAHQDYITMFHQRNIQPGDPKVLNAGTTKATELSSVPTNSAYITEINTTKTTVEHQPGPKQIIGDKTIKINNPATNIGDYNTVKPIDNPNCALPGKVPIHIDTPAASFVCSLGHWKEDALGKVWVENEPGTYGVWDFKVDIKYTGKIPARKIAFYVLAYDSNNSPYEPQRIFLYEKELRNGANCTNTWTPCWTGKCVDKLQIWKTRIYFTNETIQEIEH